MNFLAFFQLVFFNWSEAASAAVKTGRNGRTRSEMTKEGDSGNSRPCFAVSGLLFLK